MRKWKNTESAQLCYLFDKVRRLGWFFFCYSDVTACVCRAASALYVVEAAQNEQGVSTVHRISFINVSRRMRVPSVGPPSSLAIFVFRTSLQPRHTHQHTHTRALFAPPLLSYRKYSFFLRVTAICVIFFCYVSVLAVENRHSDSLSPP